MSYVFDPDVIAEIVREALREPGFDGGDPQTPADGGDPQTLALEDRIVRIQAGLAKRYPGQISLSGEWYLCQVGGGTQQLTILHASLTEYVTIVGIPCMTQGFSGRYATEIYDFVFDGALENYAAGDFRSTVYGPGDVSRFKPGEGRNYAIRERLWMVEYTRGPIPGMFTLPLVDTVFGSLDYRSLFRLMGGFTSAMLQRLFGNGVWQNWMGNLTCTPALVFRPTSLGELSAIVKQARRDGRKVRLYGARHSWMPLAPTDDYLVDISLMKRCLEIDQTKGTMRVETGMTVGELTTLAASKGLFIKSPTVATNFTVGGLVATGSHGTGLEKGPHGNERTFADSVVRFTVVRADGEVVEIGPESPDDLTALRCSLGALGIIYAVTIKCPPATNWRVQNLVMPLEQAIQQIPEVIHAHNGVEMFWFPYTKNATFRVIDPSDDPVTYGLLQKLWAIVEQDVLEGIFGSIGIFIVTRIAPSLTPVLTTLSANAMGPCDWVMSPIDAYHYQYYYPLVWDSEFAIPLERASEAFQGYVDLVNDFQKRGLYPVNMVVHARFTNGDATWLSPDFGRDSCYIESVTAKSTPHVQELYHAAEDMLMDRFDGRPHWAKVWYDMDRVRRRYETNLRRFEVVRAKWDPEGRFLNAFLTRLFAPFHTAVEEKPVQPARMPTDPPPAA